MRMFLATTALLVVASFAQAQCANGTCNVGVRFSHSVGTRQTMVQTVRTTTTIQTNGCTTARSSCHGGGVLQRFHDRRAARHATGCSAAASAGCSASVPQAPPMQAVPPKK